MGGAAGGEEETAGVAGAHGLHDGSTAGAGGAFLGVAVDEAVEEVDEGVGL